MIHNRKSLIQDDYVEKYLAEKELNLTANGLSSVRMRTAMICRRLSLAVSTAVSGSREMSHIIRLMMLRMVYFILNTRSWQMQKIM